MSNIPVSEGHGQEPREGLRKVAYYLLLGFIFLIPVLIVPSSIISFSFSKSIFITLATIVVLAIYLLSILKSGQIKYPSFRLLLVVPLLLVAYLLAAIFSEMPMNSLLGYGFEITTFSSILILFVLMFLVSQLFNRKENIFYAYLAFFAAFLLLAVFHLLRFVFGAEFLSLGVFTDITSNTVGKWSDLAVFFGAGAVLALVTLEEIKLNRKFRSILQVVLAISIVFLAIINFSMVWYVLGGFGLIYFVLAVSSASRATADTGGSKLMSSFTAPQSDSNEDLSAPGSSEYGSGEYGSSEYATPSASSEEYPAGGRKISINALVVLLLSFTFILSGNMVGDAFAQYLGVQNLDVRPSWSATQDIAQDTVSERPVFGSGPNRFLNQWLISKPEGINQTRFWNTDFNFGVGLIPTFLITTGVVGFAAWLLFLGVFVYLGFKMMFVKTESPLTRYFITSSFMVALFLWMMNILYVPSAAIFALTIIFTGLFGASLYLENLVPVRTVSFYRYPRAGFVTVLALVLVLMASITFGYIMGQKTLASAYFQLGGRSANEGELEVAEQRFRQAASLGQSDIYYRPLSQFYMAQATRVAQERQSEQLTEDESARFQQALQTAVAFAQEARDRDPTNYLNWQNLGQIYQQALSFGVGEAYSRAKEAYEEALARNPRSPSLKLQLARLEVANDDLAAARDYLIEARELRQNYTEAIFLLARIEAAEGNLDEAIEQTRQALMTSPRDPGLRFELGLLYYNTEQYSEASEAFEQAVELLPNYANAKYFLGLSYAELDQRDQAMEVFQDLKEQIPDNELVTQVLDNLRSGDDPLEGLAQPNTDSDTVDPDEELPVEEGEQSEDQDTAPLNDEEEQAETLPEEENVDPEDEETEE